MNAKPKTSMAAPCNAFPMQRQYSSKDGKRHCHKQVKLTRKIGNSKTGTNLPIFRSANQMKNLIQRKGNQKTMNLSNKRLLKFAIRVFSLYTVFQMIPMDFWNGLLQGLLYNAQHAIPGCITTAIWIAIILYFIRTTLVRIKMRIKEITQYLSQIQNTNLEPECDNDYRGRYRNGRV